MNNEAAFVRDRGMTLSEYEWMMVETALLKYANDIVDSSTITTIQLQIAKRAYALAKDIRFTEDCRNQQRDWDEAERNLIGF